MLRLAASNTFTSKLCNNHHRPATELQWSAAPSLCYQSLPQMFVKMEPDAVQPSVMSACTCMGVVLHTVYSCR